MNDTKGLGDTGSEPSLMVSRSRSCYNPPQRIFESSGPSYLEERPICKGG